MLRSYIIEWQSIGMNTRNIRKGKQPIIAMYIDCLTVMELIIVRFTGLKITPVIVKKSWKQERDITSRIQTVLISKSQEEARNNGLRTTKKNSKYKQKKGMKKIKKQSMKKGEKDINIAKKKNNNNRNYINYKKLLVNVVQLFKKHEEKTISRQTSTNNTYKVKPTHKNKSSYNFLNIENIKKIISTLIYVNISS